MSPLLQGIGATWDRGGLDAAVAALARVLRERECRVLATLMDNSPAWVIADAAAAAAGVVHVPLPLFFTPQQVAHALHRAGVDTLLTSPALAAHWPQVPQQACEVAGQGWLILTLPTLPVALPRGTGKVTFTSGTTGTPKGVCLGQAAMQRAAQGLVQALQPLQIRRHLCVLPLAVLLENLAGVLAPLAAGATVVVPPLADVGMTGSSSFDPAAFQAAVQREAPDSIILLPQMLRAWTAWLRHTGERAPGTLKIAAVGGAAVGSKLLLAARDAGIPAFEGYGLSEGGSVQTLNLPGADRPGSVGRALPHARVRVTPGGEIEVAGTLMAGYLGDPSPVPEWWPTGDLGRIDIEGFVHVQGRSRHVLVTGFGRNVSPEWVETALRGEAAIAQAAVFGEGQPVLSAVLWPAAAGTTDAALAEAVAAANAGLPDYARIGRWVRGRCPFTVQAGVATANGRPRRGAILALHPDALGLAATDPSTKGNHAILS